ncbi:MAG: 3-hydroxyisobutyrate dehydrogenase [Hyphomicrobiaceae bacterium]|jgi:3-hydroxyisobutyrate dehydrogenase
MSETVAYLGMGRMGGAMAVNLARAGHTVRVWNRTADRASVGEAIAAGCIGCTTVAEAVQGASVVFSCLSDVPDVEQVLAGDEGVATHAAAGTTVVDMSTIGPIAARELAEELTGEDLRFVDAPVSGGDIGAIAGTLTIMVGATEDDFARVRPLLDVMGSNVHHCGPVGAGQSVKLCNQVLGAGHMVALTEALELSRSLGLDPAMVVDVCKTGAAGSWALEHLGPRQIVGDFAPGFSIAHLLKDLRLVQEAADDVDAENLAGVDTAIELFEEAVDADGGDGGNIGTQALSLAYKT